MVWHPECRVGVVGLANGRYAGPYTAVVDACAALVASGRYPHGLDVASHRDVGTRIRPVIDQALMSGDFALIMPLLSANVAQDEELSRRAEKVAGLAAIHGELTSEDDVLEVSAPTKVRWWLAGQNRSRVSIAIMLTPQLPPKVQTLQITSVRSPTVELEEAAARVTKSVTSTKVDTGLVDILPLLRPLRGASWVACDGQRTGELLLKGTRVDCLVHINLDSEEEVTHFTPLAKLSNV
jgi:hypothetical protein